jgi:hypothetical protein
MNDTPLLHLPLPYLPAFCASEYLSLK